MIPDFEDDIRLFKLTDEESAESSHFASEEEAQGVANNLADDDWRKANCRTCSAPGQTSPALSGGIAQRTTPKPSRRNHLYRRGNVLGACCKVPKTLPDLAPVIDDGVSSIVDSENVDPDDVDSIDFEAQSEASISEPIHPLVNSGYIPEDQLQALPDLKTWDPSSGNADDIAGLSQDLIEHNTGVVAWSSKLKGTMDSETILKEIRKVFTRDPSDELYKALKIKSKQGTERLFSASFAWKDEEILKPWKEFTDAAIEDAIATTRRLRKIDDSVELKGQIEFFLIKPSEQARTGIDLRPIPGAKGPVIEADPFHVDSSILSFSAADTPGLLVKNPQGKASRVPIIKNGFHTIKGYWYRYGTDKSIHGVYGPQMADEGRASLVLSVYDPRQAIL